MDIPYVGWAIYFQGSLIHSSIRMLRKFAIDDYVKDVGLPTYDWKQCVSAGCRVMKVWIYTEKQAEA